MDISFETFLQEKGYIIKKSPSAKIIEKFDKERLSVFLFDYLKNHPSCRVLFNTLVKSKNPFVEPLLVMDDFKEALKISETSFIFLASCSCDTPLDKPNITDSDYLLPDHKEITCHKCNRKNHIIFSNYVPNFDFQYVDFLKFINKAKEYQLFLISDALECIYCNNIIYVDENSDEIENINLKCPKCKNILYSMPKYLFDTDLYELINNQQGYWLEWYIWNQLKSFKPMTGKTLIKEEDGDTISFEIDLGFIYENKRIIIECKDNDDLKDTLQNLPFINDIADIWILVATKKIKPGHLSRLKSGLKNKFVHITPKDVDNVKSIISKLIKIPPKSDFTMSKTTVNFPGTVKFTDTSLNSPTSWKWDFGDGQTSELQNPDHKYVIRGVHKITLEVTNEAGSDISEKHVRVIGFQ